MDRDPFIQAENDNRSAQVIQVEALGKAGVAVMLATAIMAVIIASMAYGLASRANDRAQIAEREARVFADQLQTARIEFAKRGIVISTDDHQ